jgi:hypothetical protein
MLDDTPNRYFVAIGKNSRWQEVTKEDYVRAERQAGFYPTYGPDSEPCTGGFGTGAIQGTLCYRGDNLPEDFIPLTGEPTPKD